MRDLDFIKVVFGDLPPAVHGFTVCEDSDFYTVTLNSRLSHEMQVDAYWHEVSHILGGDFSRMQDVNRDLMDESDVNLLEKKRHK